MFAEKTYSLVRLFLGLALLLASTSANSQPRLSIRTPSNAVELTFQGILGTTNRVEWISTLGLTNWTSLTNVVLTSNQFVTVIHPTVTNLPERFYRLAVTGGSQTNPTTTVLFDNLTGTTDGSTIRIAGGESGFERVRVAAGFTITNKGQSGGFTFTLRVNNPNNSPMLLSLVGNNGGYPGESEIFSLTSTSAPSGFYKFFGEGTLDANTTYWLVVSAGSSLANSFNWVNRGAYNSQYNSFAIFAGLRVEQGNGVPGDFSWGAQNNFFPGIEIAVTPAAQRSLP